MELSGVCIGRFSAAICVSAVSTGATRIAVGASFLADAMTLAPRAASFL